jgi:hypothetical protein
MGSMSKPTNSINRPRTTTRATIEVPNVSMHELLAHSRTTVEIEHELLADLVASCGSKMNDVIAQANEAARMALTCSDGIELQLDAVKAASIVMLSSSSVAVADVMRELAELGLQTRACGHDLLVGETVLRFPAADRVDHVQLRHIGETSWRLMPLQSSACVAALALFVGMWGLS